MTSSLLNGPEAVSSRLGVSSGKRGVGAMRPGEWRLLTSKEIAALKAPATVENRKA